MTPVAATDVPEPCVAPRSLRFRRLGIDHRLPRIVDVGMHGHLFALNHQPFECHSLHFA